MREGFVRCYPCAFVIKVLIGIEFQRAIASRRSGRVRHRGADTVVSLSVSGRSPETARTRTCAIAHIRGTGLQDFKLYFCS